MFSFRPTHHRGKRRWHSVFSVLMAIGMIFSIVALFPVEVSAKTYASMNLEERVRSYNYAHGLLWCFGKNRGGVGAGTSQSMSSFHGGSAGDLIDPANALSGDWFGGHWNLANEDFNVIVGYIDSESVREENGKDQMQCNQIVKSATVLWGYSNPLQLLCDFSPRQDGTCADSPTNSAWKPNRDDSVKRFEEKLKEKVYGGKSFDTPAPEELYYMANATFFNSYGCNAKPLVNGKTSEGLDPATLGVGVYKSVKTVSFVTSTKTTYYKDGTNVDTKTGTETKATDPDVVEYNYNALSAMAQAGVYPPSKTVEVQTPNERTLDYYGVKTGDHRSVHAPSNRPECSAIAKLMNDNYAVYFNWAKQNAKEAATISQNSGNPLGTNCQADPTNPDCSDLTTSCAIPGIGWMLCPVLEFMSSVTDSVYGIIDGWLETNIKILDTSGGAYAAWQQMRNIANVGLVIVFLIVIFSQLTGAGISNYGIKKILPKLVLMAVLINISFFIMQLAVDVSNILGGSLKEVIANGVAVYQEDTGFLASGNTFSDVALGLMAGNLAIGAAVLAIGGTIYFGGVGLFIMIVLSALISVLITFLILAARQALIVLLIVIAPLAFVAMILPNTKKWYDNWQRVFVALLLVYPMVAVVFGASALASDIIASTIPETGVPGVLLALAVATVPLFMVIPLLKNSLNAIPAIGNLAQKAMKLGTGGLNNAIRSRGKEMRANMGNSFRKSALDGDLGRAGKYLAGGRARRQQRAGEWAGDVQRAEAEYIANRTLDNPNATLSAKSSAVGALSKLKEEEISNIMALNKHKNLTGADHVATLRDPSSTNAQRIAAVRAIGEIGGLGQVNEMAELSSAAHMTGEDHASVRQEMASVAAKRFGTQNPAWGGSRIAGITNGNFSGTAGDIDYATSNEFTAKSLLDMHDGSRERLLQNIQESGNEQAIAALQRIRDQINGDDTLRAGAGAQLIQQIDARLAGSPTLVTGSAVTGEIQINHNVAPPAAAPPPPSEPQHPGQGQLF